LDTLIKPREEQIPGKMKKIHGRVVLGAETARVDGLIEKYLKNVCSDDSGRDQLYPDGADGWLGERICVNSDGHGGTPSLFVMTHGKANAKYGRTAVSILKLRGIR